MLLSIEATPYIRIGVKSFNCIVQLKKCPAIYRCSNGFVVVDWVSDVEKSRDGVGVCGFSEYL